MTSSVPDPFDEDLAHVLADEELMARLDEFHRRLQAGQLKTYTHEEVLQRLWRFGIQWPLADRVTDSEP